MSDELIIKYCSPTLAGIKTGNMFTMPYHTIEGIKQEICEFNRQLSKKGLIAIPLRYNKNRVLIYIYRPEKLRIDLKDNIARKLLKSRGYSCSNPNCCIRHLVKRISESNEFPHEIGLFLGYPSEDVQGFIYNKAENYKFTGVWKVYGDEQKARKTFEKYKKCTEVYYKQWKNGKPIERLVVAV